MYFYVRPTEGVRISVDQFLCAIRQRFNSKKNILIILHKPTLVDIRLISLDNAHSPRNFN